MAGEVILVDSSATAAAVLDAQRRVDVTCMLWEASKAVAREPEVRGGL